MNKLLLVLLIFAIFTRFWMLGEFFTFNFDEEYQALLAWEQVKHPHPIWIGVSASNINYYLGPGFTYLNALLFYITKDPMILAFFGSSLGIITIISIYFVTSRLFSKKAALFASLFYTGSLFINYFDRRFWNDTPIPLISLWILYSLVKATKDTRWFIFSVFLMAVSLHVHLSLLAFWPVILYVAFLKRKKIKAKTYLFSAAAFIGATLPLLVFDVVHNFDNMLMPLRYLQKLTSFSQTGNPIGAFQQLADSLSRLWFIRPFSNVQDEIQLGIHGTITQAYLPLTVFSLFIMGWLFTKMKKNYSLTILVICLLSFLIVYIFYPGGVVAYFLLGFFTLFAINVGLFLARIPLPLSVTIILVFLAVNTYSLLTTQQKQFGLLTRKELIRKIMSVVKDKPFYLETRTKDGRKYHSAGGWRYLFKAYGKTPAQSHADDFFGWIYQDEIAAEHPPIRVIISEYPSKIEKTLGTFNEGVYYSYIVTNEKN